MTPKLTRDDITRTLHLSSRDAASELGVGKTTINDYRRMYKVRPASTNDPIVAEDATMEGVLEELRQGKTDLANHSLSFTTVERELADGSVKHQYTVRAVPQKGASALSMPNADELVQAINEWVPEQVEYNPTKSPVFVVLPADLQVGKVSDNGGTDELEERVKRSFDRAAARCRDAGGYPFIVMADLGDIIENFYNTSAQRETNDRDLTSQVRIARSLMAYGVRALAPYCQKMYVVSVPSNHASVRVGFKADAAHPSNDWGIAINDQLKDIFAEREEFAHVEFVVPTGLEDSVAVNLSITDGEGQIVDSTTFGFMHGHQAVKAEKIGDWWRGQSLGRGPVATADVLLVGHFHSYRKMQAGDERWIVVAPSSDNGSDWYRRLTGDKATAGMLTFEATNGSLLREEIV